MNLKENNAECHLYKEIKSKIIHLSQDTFSFSFNQSKKDTTIQPEFNKVKQYKSFSKQLKSYNSSQCLITRQQIIEHFGRSNKIIEYADGSGYISYTYYFNFGKNCDGSKSTVWGPERHCNFIVFTFKDGNLERASVGPLTWDL